MAADGSALFFLFISKLILQCHFLANILMMIGFDDAFTREYILFRQIILHSSLTTHKIKNPFPFRLRFGSKCRVIAVSGRMHNGFVINISVSREPFNRLGIGIEPI